MQTVPPVFARYVPVAHEVQEVDPATAMNDPAGHAMQVGIEFVTTAYCPVPHMEHVLLIFEYWYPEGHLEHTATFVPPATVVEACVLFTSWYPESHWSVQLLMRPPLLIQDALPGRPVHGAHEPLLAAVQPDR